MAFSIKQFIYSDTLKRLNERRAPSFYCGLQTQQQVFTFGRNVDKHRVTECSKLLSTEHFASNPNFMNDVCLKSVQRANG